MIEGLIWTLVPAALFVLGFFLGTLERKKNSQGILIVDEDAQNIHWTLDVHIDPAKIMDYKHVQFRVMKKE